MTNYKATLLIDQTYARDNYNKWATPEAADKEPGGMVVTCNDILYLMEWERRRANNGGDYHYCRWCDPSGLQRPADDWLDVYLPDARELVNAYFDARSAGRVQGSVYIRIYKTVDGAWELIEAQGSGEVVWRQDGSQLPIMSYVEAARYITAAMGVARWEEVTNG